MFYFPPVPRIRWDVLALLLLSILVLLAGVAFSGRVGVAFKASFLFAWIALLLGALALHRRRARWWPAWRKTLRSHGRTVDALDPAERSG